MRKWLNTPYFKLNALMITAAAALTVYLVITGAYIQEGETIAIGDLSPRRFIATRQVENRVATEKLRQEAEASVSPRYARETAVDEKILSRMDDFFEEIVALRKAYTPIFVPSGEFGEEYIDPDDEAVEASVDLSSAVGGADNPIINPPSSRLNGQEGAGAASEDSLKTELLNDISEEQLQYLLEMPTPEFNTFEENMYLIANEMLENGVREDTLQKTLVDTRAEFEKIYGQSPVVQLGYDIVALYIEPNHIIDEEATQKLKEERVGEVEPVYFKKGQSIINDREIITEEIYYVLDDLGFVSKGLLENGLPILGAVALVLGVLGFSFFYIFLFHKDLYQNKKEGLLLFTIYVLVVVIGKLLVKLPFVFVPVLAFTMLVGILLEFRLALVLNLSVSIITLLIFKGDLDYLLYYTMMGTVVALTARYASQRNNIFIVSLIISVLSALICGALGILLEREFTADIAMNLLYAFLDGFFTVIVCIGSLPLWEAVFGVVTPIKLMDLVNPNNELLRRLTIEAPGTYHHSLIVANLAETAAYDIGADSSVARVGGYYHDIGKLHYPHYFSENQLGENPHDGMDPYSSVEVITSHVAFGLEMADENKLPKPIKDIIAQHHGNTLVKYFYYKAREAAKDSGVPLNEDDFRYLYDIPKSREAAVVMLADTVEAAVRSMVSKSKAMDEVDKFVRELIKDKLDDGQLKESGFSIKDLDTVADSFMRVFKGMYHERIPYPKESKKALVKTEGIRPELVSEED